jgi:outer membrane immunogenic protein
VARRPGDRINGGFKKKKLFLATTSIAALATVSAGAADLSRPVMKAPPPPPPPACAQFGGFYVGGQVGATYYDHYWQDLDAFRSVAGDNHQAVDSANASKSGWNAGIQAGYNWQMSRCTVFGVEADWSWTNTRAEKRNTLFGTGEDDYINVSSRMKSFGTVRARTGVVVDNLLIYVTGGVAWARFDRDFTFFSQENGGETEVLSASHNRWGWTAGVGTEWAITPSVSLKSEVLYIGFQQKEYSITSTFFDPGFSYRFDSRDSVWVSRVGLNFRWGGPPAPVMAKY